MSRARSTDLPVKLTVLLACTVWGQVLLSADSLPTVSDLLSPPFDAQHIDDVVDGKAATTKITEMDPRELAVGVACVLRRDRDEIEHLIVSGALLSPEDVVIASGVLTGEASAFGGITAELLTEGEVQHYLAARPETKLNLSSKEIDLFRGLRTATPAEPGPERVVQGIRDMLAERHRSYVRSGLKGIAPYVKTRGRLQSPGEDLRLSTTAMEHLKALDPTLYDTLSRTHTEGLRDVRGTFLWSIAQIKERRGLVLEHRLESVAEDFTSSFKRAYYVSHSMDAMQAVVGLRETVEGTLFVYVSQLWTEQVTGVGSSLKRSLGRRHLTRAMTRIVESLGICDSPGAASGSD